MPSSAAQLPRSASYALRCVSVVAICFGAYHAGRVLSGKSPEGDRQVSSSSVADTTVGGLFIEPASLSIGEVWETPSHVVSLPVANKSDHAIRITKFVTSCDCTQVEPEQISIAAGETRLLRATLDLTHRQPYQVGMARRELTVDLTPVLDDAPAPATRWTITGTIRSRITLSADILHFKDMCHRHATPVTRKIRATAHDTTTTIEACPHDACVAVRVVPRLDKADTFDILVTPDPNGPIGAFRSRVDVIAIDASGRKQLSAWFVADGEMLPPARLLPAQVFLGEQPIGAKVAASVAVILPAGPQWAVEKVDTDSTDTHIEPGPEIGGLRSYTLTQTISGTEHQSRTVYFVVRGPGGKKTRSIATVSYFAMGVTSAGEEN